VQIIDRRTFTGQEHEPRQVVDGHLQIDELCSELTRIDTDQDTTTERSLEARVFQSASDIVTTPTLGGNQPNDRHAALRVGQARLFLERHAQGVHSVADVSQKDLPETPRPRRFDAAVVRYHGQRLQLGKVMEPRRRDHGLRRKGQGQLVSLRVALRRRLQCDPGPGGDP
jgi:hypothetical protein